MLSDLQRRSVRIQEYLLVVVIGCFLGAILYFTNVRRNVYHEGSTADMAMGKLLQNDA